MCPPRDDKARKTERPGHRSVGLPTTIGLMMISPAVSVVPVALGRTGVTSVDAFVEFVTAIEFDEAVLNSMLGALLFASVLHVNLDDLAPQKGVIALLATLGIAISTLVVGGLTCLLFGAIGPPTDSIAVGAILKSVGVPDTLLTKITCESPFNDGVGVVVFLLLLELAVGAGDVTAVDNYLVEILVPLAIVTGGYAFANSLHLSGPLAMLVAGLLLGNRGRRLAMPSGDRLRGLRARPPLLAAT